MTLFTCRAAVFRAVLVAGLMFPFGAMAEEDLGWYGDAYEGGATLFYGVPQSDYAPVSFSCRAGSAAVSFVYAFEPLDAGDGMAVEVMLQAGDIEVPIGTTGVRMQMDYQFLLEGETALDTRLADLLTSQGTLLVFVEDGVEEYPLDGAREAAAALIETCGIAATDTAAIQICDFDAWVQGDGPDAVVIRDGPSTEAAALADMPGPYPGYNDIAYPTVSITGARDGWFRIDEATTDRYADKDLVVAFTGEGWVPGRAMALYVESSELYEFPAYNAAVTADFRDGSHNFLIVDRLYACRGRWVEVGGTFGDSRVRGWSADICESQITTCP